MSCGFYGPTRLFFQILRHVVARLPRDRHHRAGGMNKVAVAAFAATVRKPSAFQVSNQLSNLARHRSIKVVSQVFASVNGGRSRFHFQPFAGRRLALAVVEAEKSF